MDRKKLFTRGNLIYVNLGSLWTSLKTINIHKVAGLKFPEEFKSSVLKRTRKSLLVEE